MAEWKPTKIERFLKERAGRYAPEDNAVKDLKRLNKIDFSGEIHLSDKDSKTDMIIIEPGDLVISGINVSKGALAVYHGDEPITATIHYSSYIFDEDEINIEYFKRFLKSEYFVNALKEQVKGGIKAEIKSKHFLPLEINLPDIDAQKEIVSFFSRIENEMAELSDAIKHQQSYLKKIRQQILQEAIEGKLTAEWRKTNPKLISGDNHASKLLEKIKAEKERLIKQRIVGKDKLFSPIADEDKQFVLPEGWAWCRFGEYAFFERGRFSIRPRNDKSCYGGKYPFIQIGSLNNEGSVIVDFKQTLNEKGFSVSKQFKKGTIAIAIVGGTIGNLGVLGIDMCFPDSMVGIRPTINSNQKYVLLLLRSKQPEIRKAAYQMAGQPNIKLPTLTGLVVALPPLVEQQAIVERANKIMAVIDELEKQVAERKDKSARLMQSVLREAFTQ